MLKIVIVVLVVALIVSLGSGFYFLMMDQGNIKKRRLFNSLAVRVTLAVTLILVIVYGVATGQLGHRNPWDPGPGTASQANEGK